jgi:hypothetical protein
MSIVQLNNLEAEIYSYVDEQIAQVQRCYGNARAARAARTALGRRETRAIPDCRDPARDTEAQGEREIADRREPQPPGRPGVYGPPQTKAQAFLARRPT